jgi:hypothetical protein
MALNEVFKEGQRLSLPVPTGTLAGSPLRIGILNAVTQTDEGSVTDPNNVINGVAKSTAGVGNKAGFASVFRGGAHVLTVTGAVAKAGDPVYIKADNTLTTVATGAFLFGAALQVKGAPAGDIIVQILQPGQVAANA